MTDLRTAAQQALEALKCLVETYEMGNTIRADIMGAEEAIASLKAALEQPEQEPVAWMRNDGLKAMPADEKTAWAEADLCHLISDYTIPLYTHPPRREGQGLSEEEILPLYSMLPSSHAEMLEFARAIEAALRSKNHE